jgi:hypothetical protein
VLEDAEDAASAAARHNELRDIHRRIDSLKEESERQYGTLIDRLHSLEVAVARGGRFPPAAWVSAVGILVVIVGQAMITYSKLETTTMIATQAFQAINEHQVSMSERTRVSAQLEERIKSLEGRIVGIGPNGWHRPDHEEYAKRIDIQISGLNRRVDDVEDKQDKLCDRLRNCNGVKR